MRYSGMIVLLLAVAGTAPSASAQARAAAEVELQAARNVEEVEGNLARAIDLYKGIVAKYGTERDIAAQALLSLGRSYEKLGSQEAARAYQRVVAEYGDQSAAAAQARARLGALQANAAAGSDRGPVTRRLLSSADTDNDNFVSMRPSPDGGQVAYIEMGVTGPLGALQLRDLRSGVVQTLVPGSPSWNWSPTWSPDGTRIAFLDAISAKLKIVEVGTRKVSEVPGTAVLGLSPADWSRDGRFLLCARQSLPSRLGAVLVSPTSGEVTPLADSASGGSFSPDSRFVVFAAREGGEQHLFVQPVTGGPARQLTSGDGTDLFPLWSPDGKAIAYQRSSGIWVIPMMNGAANGAPRRALGQAEPMSTPASWVANGLYYTFYNISTAAYQLPVEPATARPAGSAQRLPAPADPFLTWGRSPDGRQTAFAAISGTITIKNEDSKSTASFSLGSESLGSEGASWNAWWSGDGNEVLYTSTFRSRQGMGATIFALDPKTGRVRTLLPRRLMANRMSMSADGRRVVFGLGSDTLVVIGPGRGDSVVVTSEDAPHGHLSGYVRLQFSPDGKQLLFGRQGPPNKAGGSLWVAGSDGNGMRKIASAPVLTGAVWDPSGRFIAYSSFMVYPPNLRRAVVRVVELASGTEWELPLSVEAGFLRVTDWSRDGRYIGLTAREDRYEYWVAERLLDAGR